MVSLRVSQFRFALPRRRRNLQARGRTCRDPPGCSLSLSLYKTHISLGVVLYFSLGLPRSAFSPRNLPWLFDRSSVIFRPHSLFPFKLLAIVDLPTPWSRASVLEGLFDPSAVLVAKVVWLLLIFSLDIWAFFQWVVIATNNEGLSFKEAKLLHVWILMVEQ